jgi:ethylbenzene dioxygenase ferredoxin subunit
MMDDGRGRAGVAAGRLRLFAASELAPGTARRFAVPGRPPLAVFNVDGEIFVTDDRCTHGMASLSEGTLEGDVIECPWHGGAFNVRTGAALAFPCTESIRTYDATIEDGYVVVEYH